MKSFKQFLLEYRRFVPNSKLSFGGSSDLDLYGEHKKRSPEEFGQFIESLTDQMIKSETDIKNSGLPLLNVTLFNNQRHLDYHIANPDITDEHLHHAIPHLLNWNFTSTLVNSDIPWHVLKPHAELDLVASPTEEKIFIFNLSLIHI